MWGLSAKTKPGYKTENASRCLLSDGINEPGEERSASCFLYKCVCLCRTLWQNMQILGHTWGKHCTQHHTQFPGCFNETWYFLLPPPRSAESCVCMLLCFVTMHVIDLFVHCCSRAYFLRRAGGRSCIHICGRPVCAHHGGTRMLLYVFVSMFVLR